VPALILPRVGRRPVVELQWLHEVPGLKDLRRLNDAWPWLDWDAPELTELGLLGVWRKPLLHPLVSAAFLHALGHMSRVRWVPDADELEEAWPPHVHTWADLQRAALDVLPWWASDPEVLRGVAPWDVWKLRGWSRSVDRLLPPAGPFPADRRRRFGSRRGVRRLRPQNVPG
jgi:hypothetical protein